jgi:hypothetical protein
LSSFILLFYFILFWGVHGVLAPQHLGGSIGVGEERDPVKMMQMCIDHILTACRTRTLPPPWLKVALTSSNELFARAEVEAYSLMEARTMQLGKVSVDCGGGGACFFNCVGRALGSPDQTLPQLVIAGKRVRASTVAYGTLLMNAAAGGDVGASNVLERFMERLDFVDFESFLSSISPDSADADYFAIALAMHCYGIRYVTIRSSRGSEWDCTLEESLGWANPSQAATLPRLTLGHVVQSFAAAPDEGVPLRSGDFGRDDRSFDFHYVLLLPGLPGMHFRCTCTCTCTCDERHI